jgi:molybdate transport system substrate-binding protein
MSHKLRLAACMALPLIAAATSASAAEVKVLNANALTIAMKEIAADFTKETGNQVTFLGLTPGQVDQRVHAGDSYDLVITATEGAAALEKEGKFRAGTRHPLARVGIGLAVKEGVKVDLSTVESTRKALLDAKSITYSDSSTGGLSGINAKKVIENLGLTDALRAKTKIASGGGLEGSQGPIGKGEIEIGLFNLSEIPRAPGVVRAGPVPAQVEVYINYDSAIPASNETPEAALAFIKYMHRAAARPVWDKAGLEVAGE